MSKSHAPKRVDRRWSPISEQVIRTLWFDRARLRVWDNAHHLACTMLPVVNISQFEIRGASSAAFPNQHRPTMPARSFAICSNCRRNRFPGPK